MNFNQLSKSIDSLIDEGNKLLQDLVSSKGKPVSIGLISKEDKGTLTHDYHSWHLEAKAIIEQLAPANLPDFDEQYKYPGNRKSLDAETYRISDYLIGLAPSDLLSSFDTTDVTGSRLHNQIQILRACKRSLDSELYNLRSNLWADLFDSELEAARELRDNGFDRCAGAISGVVLEKHFQEVSSNHSIVIGKKNPGLNDFIGALKDKKIIDVPEMRRLQRLADLRNLCDHSREREPTKEEVLELIDGADKTIKTLK